MIDTIEAFYAHQLQQKNRAMTPHLETIRAYANRCEVAVEFGVKHGASSSALLMEAGHVISYDILETPQARQLQRIAGDQWEYRIEDSVAAIVPPCDLLLVDSLHTYAHCNAELNAHADRVRRYLLFHDVTTFGEVGAEGESGRQSWTYVTGQSVPAEHTGIRPAIDFLMIRDPSWRIEARYTHSHGLLVLERR